MVIVRLWGGLGNQMFQYAAARRLALVNQAPLKLDLGWFSKPAPGDTRRPYELHVFNSVQEVASPAEVKALRGVDIRRWPKLAKRLVKATGILANRSCVREKYYHFDPEILRLRGDVYLDGYWQSARYFEDVAGAIRADFTFAAALDPRNQEMCDSIRNCEAVSLHVRRGDYISNKAASQHHGSNSLEYYRAAITEMTGRVAEPHFFVFSDEPEWVKKNLQFGVPMTFVEHNGPDKGYEDLRLMSLCRHHIIANSSFSWWGGWLAAHPDKVVIAPKRWFNHDEVVTDDLIPEGWLRL